MASVVVELSSLGELALNISYFYFIFFFEREREREKERERERDLHGGRGHWLRGQRGREGKEKRIACARALPTPLTLNQTRQTQLRACLSGGGRTQVSEVTRLAVVKK